METPREYHYVYYSYEEYGRGYFGSRSCKCPPEEDVKYFGSFKDKTFEPTQKIILKSDYITREEAYIDEIKLQEYYKVVENSHFANRAYQTTTKFYYKSLCGKNAPMYGKVHSEETKLKISQGNKNKKFTKSHKEKISKSLTGKVRPEEVKKKMGDTRRKRSSMYPNKHSQETKNKMSKSGKGKVFWNNGEFNTKSRECPGDGWVRGRIRTL